MKTKDRRRRNPGSWTLLGSQKEKKKKTNSSINIFEEMTTQRWVRDGGWDASGPKSVAAKEFAATQSRIEHAGKEAVLRAASSLPWIEGEDGGGKPGEGARLLLKILWRRYQRHRVPWVGQVWTSDWKGGQMKGLAAEVRAKTASWAKNDPARRL